MTATWQLCCRWDTVCNKVVIHTFYIDIQLNLIFFSFPAPPTPHIVHIWQPGVRAWPASVLQRILYWIKRILNGVIDFVSAVLCSFSCSERKSTQDVSFAAVLSAPLSTFIGVISLVPWQHFITDNWSRALFCAHLVLRLENWQPSGRLSSRHCLINVTASEGIPERFLLNVAH